MVTANRTLADNDVARVLAADSAVDDAFSDLAVPADWKQMAEQIERSTTLDDDPGAVWGARQTAASGDSAVAVMAGRGRSIEVSRRFVDPIIAATLVRGLPAVPLQKLRGEAYGQSFGTAGIAPPDTASRSALAGMPAAGGAAVKPATTPAARTNTGGAAEGRADEIQR